MLPAPVQHGAAGAVDVIVIGAGPSGLAVSHCLTKRSIDHVLLERGEVANSWRKERWDSLKLLTPNWMCRLPGHDYGGEDPDGYMGMDEVVGFIDAYAERMDAPIHCDTSVTGVSPTPGGYRVQTDRGEYRSRAVMLASGAFNRPLVPKVAAGVPAGILQLTPPGYRNPDQLPDGGVLVVGAAATGLQLAEEIHRSGRPVTLSVGEHVRMPRLYRGRDIQWWMLASGLLDECIGSVDDPVRARRVSSPQLVGTADRVTLDLNVLSRQGVRLVGRFAGIRDGKAQFSGGLNNVCRLADLKMNRLLKTLDDWAEETGVGDGVDPVERYSPTHIDAATPLGLDLESGEIRSIIWATGFQPDYSWLHVPVFDRKGQLIHDKGVVAAPGLYVMGLPFMRRRKSSFIHGAEDDARALCAHLAATLDRNTALMARGFDG